MTIPNFAASEVCGNCKFFRLHKDGEYGDCMVDPPIPVIGDDEEGSDFQVNIRPMVDIVDFCSRFKAGE